MRRRILGLAAMLAVGGAWLPALGAVPGEVVLLDEQPLVLPYSGQNLRVGKIQEQQTGLVKVIALDSHGREVDLAAARRDNEKAFRDRHGKLTLGLQARIDALEKSGRKEALPVSIWVDYGTPPFDRPEVADEEALGARAAQLALLESYAGARVAGVKDELRKAGVEARSGRYSPTVFASLTPGQIRRIARNPEVAAIYEQQAYVTESDDAGTTMRTYRVWAGGNLGAGNLTTRIAILEYDGVYDGHAALNSLTHPVIFYCGAVNGVCPSGKNVDWHATMVAGVAASTDARYRGAAPNATVILSANYGPAATDQVWVDAFEWAVGNGAGVINRSEGTICMSGEQDFASRYADWATSQLWITQVYASGNRRSECPENMFVQSPAVAWTPITVGAISDANNGFWSDDAMWADSRYVDPADGQDKPEVVAPGVGVTSTNATGSFSTGSGTSFAAPNVAGHVALLLSRKAGQILWPETNKAAILASAMHDIEAGTDRDGAGAVVATVADDIYKNSRFKNLRVTDATFVELCPAGSTEYVCKKYADAFTATAGDKVRVAVAWDSWSTGGAGVDTMGADIDLQVIHPDNATVVGASWNLTNTWEVVEFVAPATGKYDIVISKHHSEPGWPGAYLGIAWGFGKSTTLPNFCTGEYTMTVGGTLGTFSKSVATTYGSTFFDSYPGWDRDQSGREAKIKVTLTATRDLTISDNDSNLDLHLVQLTGEGCAGDPVTYTPLLHTISGPATVQDLPAGVYYIIVDGYEGKVDSGTVKVTVAGP